MKTYRNSLVLFGTLATACPFVSGEPIAFEQTRFSAGTNAALGGGSSTTVLQNSLSFCLCFGDDISANAVHPGSAMLFGNSAELGSVSSDHARSVLWSWLLAPVATAGENAELDGISMWIIDGALNAQTLQSEFAGLIPNLGSDDRSVSVFEITDGYQVVDGRVAFVPETMETTLIPLPSAAALGVAGLFVLGVRRRS